MRAAAGGHVAVAKRLLEAGASIDHADGRGRTALVHAVDYRRVGMVDLLLEAGASVDYADQRGKTALMRAALGGDGATVELLLKAGADVHRVDANGWTALICAAAGDGAILRRLIDANADSGHATNDGTTALARASTSSHIDSVDLLEADIQLQAEFGVTPSFMKDRRYTPRSSDRNPVRSESKYNGPCPNDPARRSALRN
jgi:ankyrin repeat protein